MEQLLTSCLLSLTINPSRLWLLVKERILFLEVSKSFLWLEPLWELRHKWKWQCHFLWKRIYSSSEDLTLFCSGNSFIELPLSKKSYGISQNMFLCMIKTVTLEYCWAVIRWISDNNSEVILVTAPLTVNVLWPLTESSDKTCISMEKYEKLSQNSYLKLGKILILV